MAKKNLYTGPNPVLVQGAEMVAEAEAMRQTAGGTAFVEGFVGGIMRGIKDKEESKAKVDAYINTIEVPSAITLLDENNKKIALEFFRQKRSEIKDLYQKYEKDKDINILDEIKLKEAAISNFSNQADVFNVDAVEYLSLNEKNQLARGKNFDYKKYDNIFIMNSLMNIEDNGDLGFTTNGEYDKYKNIRGKYNVNNNKWNTAFLTLDNAVVQNAQKGGKFDTVGMQNNFSTGLKNMGTEEVQVALETDMIGDDQFELPNGKKAGSLSFADIWSSGGMDPKYYKGFISEKDGTYNNDWMFDDNNVNQAIKLFSMYNTDVLNDRHIGNFVQKRNTRTGRSGKLNLGKSRFTNESIYVEQRFVNNKLQEFNNAKKGDFISGFEGANTYGFKVDENGNFIYQEYNSETGKFEGDKKFNRDNAITQLIPSHYLSGGVSSAAGFNKQ